MSSTPAGTLARYGAHDMSIAGLYASRAAVDPQREFLRFADRLWTWRAFDDRVRRAVTVFSARGIARGARVAVMAANSDAFVIAFLALARLDAMLVPVNPSFGADEAAYVFDHAEVALVLAGPTAIEAARAACATLKRTPLLLAIDADLVGLARFETLLAQAEPAGDAASGNADATCLILYTSGTTGFPKGVMHSQRNFVLAGEAFVERMRLVPRERLLCVLPLFHINALFYSLGGTLAAGASLTLAERFSASAFWPLVSASRATEVNIIAAVGNILARRPRSEFVAGHALTKVYGAPISPELARTFKDEFGVTTVIEGYGMTEIPGACNLPYEGPHRYGSMGLPARHPQWPGAFAELRVLDEGGRELAAGETGELAVRTPIVMQGYYRDRLQTEAAFRDGWFLTGDLVCRDDDGYYWFVGRQKDIIRRGGENVSGAELDRVIAGHPDVAEVAAIAVPSQLGEDEILAAVVRREGSALSAADLRIWCAARLAPVKLPRYVAFCSALPHTPTHRVAKFKLKQDAALLASAVDTLAGDARTSRQGGNQ